MIPFEDNSVNCRLLGKGNKNTDDILAIMKICALHSGHF